MEGLPLLQHEARALVARLRERLLRSEALPTRFRRWLVIGRAEARRHRRETGQRFAQSPSRQILATSATLARRERLCPADADEATALLAYLRSPEPVIESVIEAQATSRPSVTRPSADVVPEAYPWQSQPDSPTP